MVLVYIELWYTQVWDLTTQRNERRPGSSPEDHKIPAMPTCEEKGKTKEERMRKEGEEGEGREKKEGAG